MTDEFERIWKEVVLAQLQHYPSIHLEALRKSQETLVKLASRNSN
jgi:hypothetical protein